VLTVKPLIFFDHLKDFHRVIFDKVSSPKNILTFVFEGEKVTEIVNMFEIEKEKKRKRKENFGCKKKSN
jgi:hypothetical protein